MSNDSVVEQGIQVDTPVNNHFDEHEDVSLMDKLKPALGTNPGGVYQDHKSGEILYIKLYPDDAQSGCEFIANRIYQRLGVPVLEGSLVSNGAKIAYASPFRADFKKLPPERRFEAQKYFVAAAYLMDFDMVGIGPENPYGNLQMDSDGQLFIVDHGAALLFKGLMGRKEPFWLADRGVSEMVTMRSANINPRSKVIFDSITPEEIQRQTATLLKVVTPELIEEVMAASLLSDEDKTKVRDLLTKRLVDLKRIYLS